LNQYHHHGLVFPRSCWQEGVVVHAQRGRSPAPSRSTAPSRHLPSHRACRASAPQHSGTRQLATARTGARPAQTTSTFVILLSTCAQPRQRRSLLTSTTSANRIHSHQVTSPLLHRHPCSPTSFSYSVPFSALHPPRPQHEETRTVPQSTSLRFRLPRRLFGVGAQAIGWVWCPN
jgi:hypothetical protein